MKILIILAFCLMAYMATQQLKLEHNCKIWEEKTIMSYDPALKMIRPKKIKTCIGD